MRVRFQRLMCNPRLTAQPGDVVDLPADEARRRIAAGDCVAADEPKSPSMRERLRGRRADGGKSTEKEGAGDAKPLEERTIPQLQAYAAERDIDLGEASKKAHILEVIITAEREREENADDGPDNE